MIVWVGALLDCRKWIELPQYDVLHHYIVTLLAVFLHYYFVYIRHGDANSP